MLGSQILTEEIISNLDPGIRQLVIALNAAGFITTDSGDGVSKPEFARVLLIPHVIIKSHPDDIVLDANLLLDWLTARGLNITPGTIQATYDPGDRSAILMLVGINDDSFNSVVSSKTLVQDCSYCAGTTRSGDPGSEDGICLEYQV